jgi:hypothetical protein
MLFKELIDVNSENHTKPKNTKRSVTVKADGSYSYRSALKVKYQQKNFKYMISMERLNIFRYSWVKLSRYRHVGAKGVNITPTHSWLRH